MCEYLIFVLLFQLKNDKKTNNNCIKEKEKRMSTEKKQDDLANNEFAALFPNVEHAKQYVKATEIGLEESKRLTDRLLTENADGKKTKKASPDKMSSSNLKRSVSCQREEMINDFLQRIFLITVDASMLFFTWNFVHKYKTVLW